MRKVLFLVIVLITTSCCTLPFVDCIRKYGYKSLNEKEENAVLLKNDSIHAVLGLNIESLIVKENTWEYVIKLVVKAGNLSKSELRLSTDSLTAVCRSIDKRFIYTRNEDPIENVVVQPANNGFTKEIVISFTITNKLFKIMKSNEVEIGIPSAYVGTHRFNLNPVIFRLETI